MIEHSVEDGQGRWPDVPGEGRRARGKPSPSFDFAQDRLCIPSPADGGRGGGIDSGGYPQTPARVPTGRDSGLLHR